MAFLIGIGLLAAFSAALLNPYGRRVLGVMFLVVCGLALLGGGALWMIIKSEEKPYTPPPSYSYSDAAAADAAAAASSAAVSAAAAEASASAPSQQTVVDGSTAPPANADSSGKYTIEPPGNSN